MKAFEDFARGAEALLDKAEKTMRDEDAAWRAEVGDAIDDGELSSKMSGRLMEINDDGVLVVDWTMNTIAAKREPFV